MASEADAIREEAERRAEGAALAALDDAGIVGVILVDDGHAEVRLRQGGRARVIDLKGMPLARRERVRGQVERRFTALACRID